MSITKKETGFTNTCAVFLSNNSDAVVALSDRWNDFFRENFKIKRIVAIRNPVEHKQPLVLKQKVDSTVTFLFLGRIADHKGIFDLVECYH